MLRVNIRSTLGSAINHGSRLIPRDASTSNKSDQNGIMVFPNTRLDVVNLTRVFKNGFLKTSGELRTSGMRPKQKSGKFMLVARVPLEKRNKPNHGRKLHRKVLSDVDSSVAL